MNIAVLQRKCSPKVENFPQKENIYLSIVFSGLLQKKKKKKNRHL